MANAEEPPLDSEADLAELALKYRGDGFSFESFVKNERRRKCGGVRSDVVDYKQYGLIPVHRDLTSWVYVSEDPQLAIAIEEIVNTFSPALSVELLLYDLLGSNSDSATCLVRYLVNYYSSNRVCDHIKTTLRNMIRWTTLAGFVPCVFVPWKKIRILGTGLSGNAAVTNLLSRGPDVHKDRYCHLEPVRCSKEQRCATHTSGECQLARSRSRRHGDQKRKAHFAVVRDGLSPPDAAQEAVQEREAHEQALPSVLQVPLEQLVDTLNMLMNNSVPKTQASVVCKIVRDWIDRDVALRLDPIKETELKIATVALWGVMKTFEHGRCPVVPECKASSCLAFYDTRTGLVTAAVDGVLYSHISAWDSCRATGSNVSTLAKRAHNTVKNWATLFSKIVEGLTAASNRHLYTSAGVDRSSLTHLADAMIASRGEHTQSGFSVAGNSFGRPMVDNLSRFMAGEHQFDMFGLNIKELPDVFTKSGVGDNVSGHKFASVSHSLSEMMSSMIREGKEVLLVRRFLQEVLKQPRPALETLRRDCKDRGLLIMAENIVVKLETKSDSTGSELCGPVTDLGPDVKLVCSYPSSVTVAHLEETLSMWTNFWRSALSGFSQFNRRHNTIQYNNKDTVRELESGSPVHVFHSMLVMILNTSGTMFADSLSARKPDSSLTVNDIMLTRDSLHPIAYGLLLANKLGLRPSDVRSEDIRGDCEEDNLDSCNVVTSRRNLCSYPSSLGAHSQERCPYGAVPSDRNAEKVTLGAREAKRVSPETDAGMEGFGARTVKRSRANQDGLARARRTQGDSSGRREIAR